MIFNTVDMIPFEEDSYNNEPALPELVIPGDLRAKWEIQDAIVSLFDPPDVSEPVVEQGFQPLWGYPYEDGMGHTDFSVLDPPDPQDALDEIRQAIDEEIEQARLRHEPFTFGLP